jgi:hypothetical protein
VDAALGMHKAVSHSIKEEEFNGVSNLVRGRCKLDECNALLDQVLKLVTK